MKYLQWIFVFIFTFCLIGVRMVENQIFYDPFLDFFKSNIQQEKFPSFDWGKIIFSHILRFLLNLIFSLGVIYFLFLNKKWTIQTGGLIILSFIFFFPIYLYCLYSHFEFGELFTFYIRRIIIQPIPLLVLIPMFYYLKKKQNHNSI